MPNTEDLPQWVKLRHHLLTPEEAEQESEETPWEVSHKTSLASPGIAHYQTLCTGRDFATSADVRDNGEMGGHG